MTGRLLAIVGPSGVGKDTVMDALMDARPDLCRARRVITRPAGPGEDFDSISSDDFRQQDAAGAFLLSWGAHGLHYGIPIQVAQDLQDGQDVLVNLSRTILPVAQTRVPELVVVNLTAPLDVLAERLAKRGRESQAAIKARLERAHTTLPATVPVIHIENDQPVAETVAALIRVFYPESTAR